MSFIGGSVYMYLYLEACCTHSINCNIARSCSSLSGKEMVSTLCSEVTGKGGESGSWWQTSLVLSFLPFMLLGTPQRRGCYGDYFRRGWCWRAGGAAASTGVRLSQAVSFQGCNYNCWMTWGHSIVTIYRAEEKNFLWWTPLNKSFSLFFSPRILRTFLPLCATN